MTNNRQWQALWSSVLCLIVLGLGACKTPVQPHSVSALGLNPAEKTLSVGERITLMAFINNDPQQQVNAQDVVWQSQDATIASVDKGEVTAHKSGETTIVAQYQGQVAKCHIRVAVDYKSQKGMPYMQWGASLESVREYEKKRGNEPYLSGSVEGDEGTTYLTILIKNDANSVLYDYFFENDRLVESQWYTNKYEDYWSLNDGGKITPEALRLVESWGFKFYGYDNSIRYPTCVAWNKTDGVLCSFGPRFRSQRTLFMFNFFQSEEPQVETETSESLITMTTQQAAGGRIQLEVTSDTDFEIDWGNGTLQAFNGGTYNYDKPIVGVVAGSQIRIVGGTPREVSLMGCRLTALEIAQCDQLHELRCPANQLTRLHLKGCPNLRLLNCANNQLQQIDLGGLTHLEELHIFRNELRELRLEACPQLQLLYAYKNQLSSIDLKPTTRLQYLHLSNNQLETLDIAHLNQLVECQTASNHLKEIKLSAQYPNLVTLNLSGNQLGKEILNHAIEALPNVSHLTVSEDEAAWKKVCTLSQNPGFEEASKEKATAKGWTVK